jgi:predicted ATP-dependent Lon-type protease
MEMDQLDRQAAEAFPGYTVRKDLVRTFSRQFPVPDLRRRIPARPLLRDHG